MRPFSKKRFIPSGISYFIAYEIRTLPWQISQTMHNKNKNIMSMTVFTEELKQANIGIFIPRKNQCNVCCEFKQGNCSEITYKEHRDRKEAAQREKDKDKTEFSGSRTKVICMDIQRYC